MGAGLDGQWLALSVRRLSEDMEEWFGHPALLAETFVNPSRFRGSCYLAAGWTPAGETRGFARSGRLGQAWPAEDGSSEAPGGRGRPGARRSRGVRIMGPRAPEAPESPLPGRLRSLFDHLRQAPEFRSTRGVRHPLASVPGGADNLRMFLAVKRSRGSLLDDPAAFDADFDAAPMARTLDKAQGRIEERTCAPAPLDGGPNDLAPLPGRRQAFRVVRRRTVIRTGKTAAEAVRDFSCDEDRSRVRDGAPPRNLASLATPRSPSCACAGASGACRRPSGATPPGRASRCARSSDPPDARSARETRPDAGASPPNGRTAANAAPNRAEGTPFSAPQAAQRGHPRPCRTPVTHSCWPTPPTYVNIRIALAEQVHGCSRQA